MFKKSVWLSLFAILVVSGTLAAGEAPAGVDLWMTDFEAAKAKAKEEKKLLLLDFTGSDWCGWCIALHKEVFDLPAFKTEAPKKFILVELDYPQEKKLPPALRAQNKKLAKVFKINGYPTIVLADPEGKTIARTGYAAGGPEKYVASLNGLLATHETALAIRDKLPASSGLDRAKLLDEWLTAEDKLGMETDEAAKFEAEIIALDAENTAGLKTKYTFKSKIAKSQGLLDADKFEEAQALCETALALPGISGEQKQEAYYIEGQCWIGKKNFVEAVASLIKSRDADPNAENVADLNKMIAQNKTLAAAQSALEKRKADVALKKGAERAQGLDQLIEAQVQFAKKIGSPVNTGDIETWSKEIIALDADNKLGLKTKYEFRECIAEAKKSTRAKDSVKAKAALEKALALPGISPDQKKQADKLMAALEVKDPKVKKPTEPDANNAAK